MLFGVLSGFCAAQGKEKGFSLLLERRRRRKRRTGSCPGTGIGHRGLAGAGAELRFPLLLLLFGFPLLRGDALHRAFI